MSATQIYEWALWAGVAIATCGIVYNGLWIIRFKLRQRREQKAPK